MNHCLQLLPLVIAFCNPTSCGIGATDCRMPPQEECPPTCFPRPGYYSVFEAREDDAPTDAMKAAGIRKLFPQQKTFDYASPYGTILVLYFDVECDDLSKFLYPTITFNDPYTGVNYPLSDYAAYAKEKGVDIEKVISYDKMFSYTFQESPVMNADGTWVSGAFSGTIALAYNMSNSLHDYGGDKKLIRTAFFLRPLFEGDDRSYVYPIKYLNDTYIRTEENGSSNSSSVE